MSTKDISPGDVIRVLVPGCTDGWDVELIERAEREVEAQVNSLAEDLYETWRRSVSGGGPKWWERPQGRKDGWRAVARKVIADRAPQPDEAGR